MASSPSTSGRYARLLGPTLRPSLRYPPALPRPFQTPSLLPLPMRCPSPPMRVCVRCGNLAGEGTPGGVAKPKSVRLGSKEVTNIVDGLKALYFQKVPAIRKPAQFSPA